MKQMKTTEQTNRQNRQDSSQRKNGVIATVKRDHFAEPSRGLFTQAKSIAERKGAAKRRQDKPELVGADGPGGVP